MGGGKETNSFGYSSAHTLGVAVKANNDGIELSSLVTELS